MHVRDETHSHCQWSQICETVLHNFMHDIIFTSKVVFTHWKKLRVVNLFSIVFRKGSKLQKASFAHRYLKQIWEHPIPRAVHNAYLTCHTRAKNWNWLTCTWCKWSLTAKLYLHSHCFDPSWALWFLSCRAYVQADVLLNTVCVDPKCEWHAVSHVCVSVCVCVNVCVKQLR